MLIRESLRISLYNRFMAFDPPELWGQACNIAIRANQERNGRVRSILLASASLPDHSEKEGILLKGVFYFFGQDYVKEC